MIRGSVSVSRGSLRVRWRRRTIYLTTRPVGWPVNVAPCDAAGDLEWVFARTRTTTALALWVGGGAVAGLVLAGAKWWGLVPIAFVLGWLNLSVSSSVAQRVGVFRRQQEASDRVSVNPGWARATGMNPDLARRINASGPPVHAIPGWSVSSTLRSPVAARLTNSWARTS
jgi:hypothetical protein